MSIAETAVARALNAVKRVTGRRVVYYTDADNYVQVTAVVGRTRVEADGQEGFVVHTEHRNYLIDAADLKIAGAPVEPDNGHWIIDDGHKFEVQPEIAGQKPWRWSDRQFIRRRIETREVSNA